MAEQEVHKRVRSPPDSGLESHPLTLYQVQVPSDRSKNLQRSTAVDRPVSSEILRAERLSEDSAEGTDTIQGADGRRYSSHLVVDQGVSLLNLAINAIYQELQVPLISDREDFYYNSRPPSYTSYTDSKSVISRGDSYTVDNTDQKALYAAGSTELSPTDVQNLMGSLTGLHKKVDQLQDKMENLMHTSTSRGRRKSSLYVQVESSHYNNLQKLNFPMMPSKSFPQLRNCTISSPGLKSAQDTDKAQTLQEPYGDQQHACEENQKYQKLKEENASLRLEVQALNAKLVTKPVPTPRLSRLNPQLNRSMSEGDGDPKPEPALPYTTVKCVAGRPEAPPSHSPLPENIRITEVTFEWTIHSYRQQFQHQKVGKELKTVSDAFYISHGGYLARLEAYLYGNGTSMGSHLSVFLRILQGKHDAHLAWPAHIKISFLLVNQTDDRSESIKAVVEHNFPRPGNGEDTSSTTTANNNGRKTSSGGDSGDCWGVLDLISHETIYSKHFIRDDKLLLQCRVHILSR